MADSVGGEGGANSGLDTTGIPVVYVLPNSGANAQHAPPNPIAVSKTTVLRLVSMADLPLPTKHIDRKTKQGKAPIQRVNKRIFTKSFLAFADRRLATHIFQRNIPLTTTQAHSMQTDPPPPNRSSGTIAAVLGIVLLGALAVVVGTPLIGVLMVVLVVLGMALQEGAVAFGELLERVAGGQILMLGAIAGGWWATRAKVYAPLVGMAAGAAVALALPVVLQPATWWLAPLTVLGVSVLLYTRQQTAAAALGLLGLGATAATYTTIPTDGAWLNIGQFLAIGGTLVAFALPGARNGDYRYAPFMLTCGFVTLLYNQDVFAHPIAWDSIVRPVVIAGLVFVALGILGPRAAFHLRRGTRPITHEDHVPGAILALCAVALSGWPEPATPSGFATPGWTLLVVGTLLLWTMPSPHSGRNGQPEARALITTCLLAIIITNPPQGNLHYMAILLAAFPLLARPAWGLLFLGAAVAAAMAHGGYVAWMAVVAGSGLGWISALRSGAKPYPYNADNALKAPFQGRPHHYRYLLLAGTTGLAWELAKMVGIPSIPAALVVLALAAIFHAPITATVERWTRS
jgi:hypothetical protein